MKHPRIALILVAVLVAFLAYIEYGPRVTPAGQPPLARIDEGNVAALQKLFNDSTDEVRVLALLSPT
jgi:hypothetical protein